MDERWVSDQNTAGYIGNMYITSDGTWRAAGGLRATFTWPTSNPVYSLYHFVQGGRSWTMVEYEDTTATARPYKYLSLAYVDQYNDTLVDLDTGRVRVDGPWRGTTYLEHNNWLYALKGYDAPIRWNGREKLPVGFSAIPAPPTVSLGPISELGGQVLSIGLGEFQERWTYGWAVSLVNDQGALSPPSAITYLRGSNPAQTGTTPPRKLTALIQTDRYPGHVRGVILWRTGNVESVSTVGQQGAAMYFVRAFSTGGKMTWVDGTPDTRLLTELDRDQVGLFPGGASIARLFKGTLFVDEGPSAPSRIRYSSPQHHEQFPGINYLQVGDETSGKVTGMLATRNALVVFKQRGIYLIRGNQSAGFRVDTLTEDVGCVAPRSIVEVPGLGAVFLSESGPHVLVGALENTGTPTDVRFIGQGVAQTWAQRVNTKALASCRAEVNVADREVWFLVPEGGDDRPLLGLAFHYEANGWSVREGYASQCLTATRDHRARLLFGAVGSSGVRTYTHAENPPVLPEYRSAWLDLGAERTQVRHVQLQGLTLGADIDFDWRVDHVPVGWTAGPDVRLQGDDYERVLPEWGTAVWGTASWYREYPTGLRYDLYACNGFTVQWRATGYRIALTGADLTFVPTATHLKKRNV
jgi:hypothetical protein